MFSVGQPDHDELQEHLNRAPKNADFARGGIPPADRDLLDFITGPEAEIKRFDIKTESFGPDAGKDGPGRLSPKQLEAALRIRDALDEPEADKHVEGFAHELPEKILSDLDIGIGEGSGAEDDIISCLEPRQKFFQFLDGRGEVRI
jgi:hypothetical protein